MAASTAVAASRKHVELSLELKRKLIQEHEHGVPFTLLGKKYHIATSTAANIWRKKDFFLRSRMSGSRKRCNDRSKYKIVNQVTALFVKSMLERNHKIDGEVIKRFARTAAAQCNFKDFHGSNGWLDSFKKRENVCWVRRRGERAAAAAVASSSTATTVAAATTSTGSSPCQQRAGGYRSDSPNLGAAAAAAAVAASTQQQHHHHQQQQQQTTTTTAATTATDQTDRESPSSLESNRCVWTEGANGPGDELACTRCTHIAAAAAALAALNSSDSIHERDHEIDDWFHGIPFLCQFFEEYQSMHQQQQQESSSASQQPSMLNATNSAMPTSTSSSSSNSTAAASASSSAASSTCALVHSSSSSSSSQQQHHHQHHQQPQQQQQHQQHQQHQHQQQQHQQQQQQQHQPHSQQRNAQNPSHSSNLGPSRSMSDAHELMDTALADGLQFRSSASMADLQQCAGELPRTISSEEMLAGSHMSQQQQYSDAMNYELESSSKRVFQQQQQLLTTRNSSTNLDIGEHQMMDINFSNSNANSSDDSLQTNQQHQQQMQHLCGRQNRSNEHQMELVVKPEPICCQQAGCSSNLVSSDYNSDDQDAFYLPAARYVRHSHHHHHHHHDSDDLGYHDDLHDCCSDHYQDSVTTTGGARELQLQADYQAELVSQVVVVANSASQQQQQQPQQQQQQQQQQTGYMDEYEYENISTIRHYPVPMQQMQQQQQQQTPSAFALASPNEADQFGTEHQQQATMGNMQLQAQQLAASGQTGFVSASGSSPPPAPLGQLSDFSSAASSKRTSTCTEYLQEQEQGIEHADHEEHNLLHNALMRSPEKLKLIDSIITLLNYASSYNRKMLAPLHEIKRCIERDLEVVLSDTSNERQQQQVQQSNGGGGELGDAGNRVANKMAAAD